MSQQLSRRQFGALALTGIGTTFLLAGCGTSATGSASGSGSTAAAGDAFKKANLNFEWWSNPVRTAYTEKILKQYTGEHPKVTFNPAPGEWATYWTKLSTQVAGHTEPDVIQMDQAYIAEYGGRGALLDMSKVASIDLTPLKSSLSAGTLDGKLYGIPTGNNAYGVGANKTLFKKAGVDLPDDKTWTWDDFLDICEKLKKGSGGEFSGSNWNAGDQDLQIWLHQHDQQLYTDKGKIGFKVDALTSWFELVKKLFDSGAGPTPAQFTNDIGASTEQTLFGKGEVGFGWMWSNQITAYQQSNKGDLALLRPPSLAGSAKKNGVYYKPSMYWSIGAQTKYPSQAGGIINYFLNSTKAAKLQLAERAVPVNEKVLAVVKPLLTETDQLGVQYLQDIKSEIKWVPPVPPKGTSTAAAVAQRHTQDVIFGRATPAAAAAAFTTELKGLMAAAS